MNLLVPLAAVWSLGYLSVFEGSRLAFWAWIVYAITYVVWGPPIRSRNLDREE